MADAPWDMSPATRTQVEYLSNLLEMLGEVDWQKLDATQASDCLTKLNAVRKIAGVEFKPMDGMDSARFAR